MNVVIISPHADDAALSLSGTLHGLARSGATLAIVTCFTRSRWAPNLRSQRSVEEVTAIRAEEDRRYARLLGAELTSLGHDEASIRAPHRDVSDLRACVRGAEVKVLARELRARVAGRTALIPLAIGDHIDHRLARSAAVRACRGQPVAFYQDMPYTSWEGWEAIERHVAASQTLARRRLYPLRLQRASHRARIRAIGCYPSQFFPWQRQRLLEHLATCGELLWTSRSAHRAFHDALPCD